MPATSPTPNPTPLPATVCNDTLDPQVVLECPLPILGLPEAPKTAGRKGAKLPLQLPQFLLQPVPAPASSVPFFQLLPVPRSLPLWAPTTPRNAYHFGPSYQMACKVGPLKALPGIQSSSGIPPHPYTTVAHQTLLPLMGGGLSPPPVDAHPTLDQRLLGVGSRG